MERRTFSIRFECKKQKAQKDGRAPVYAVITVNGEAQHLKMDIKCKPADFRRLMNARSGSSVKSATDLFRADIEEIRNRLSMAGEKVTAKRLKDTYLNGYSRVTTFKDIKMEFKKQKMEDDISDRTWGKYEKAFSYFLEDTGKSEDDDITEFKKSDVMLFEARQRKKFADTTACKNMKLVKALFSFAVASNATTVNPFGTKKIGHGNNEKDTEWLTYEEIEKIRDVNLDSERLNNVRTIFLFQCFSGLNYSDLYILQEGDVQQDEFGHYYIKKARYKTGKFGKEQIYTAYLFDDAIEIYKRYGITGFKRLLIALSNYNLYLGEIVEKAGIEKEITSKCGRKTYACFLYNTLNIKDLTIIQTMMGHTNLRQTEEYVRVFHDTLSSTINQHNHPIGMLLRKTVRIN